jgi:hypothetical protein
MTKVQNVIAKVSDDDELVLEMVPMDIMPRRVGYSLTPNQANLLVHNILARLTDIEDRKWKKTCTKDGQMELFT